jgi:hypothetical protein
MWDASGDNLVEHIAGVEDYQVAQATYRAAIERWPGAAITLRHGARVIEDSRRCGLPRGPTRAARAGGDGAQLEAAIAVQMRSHRHRLW